MIKNCRIVKVFVGAAMLHSCAAMAAVSAEEAKQLGGPALTEWGAERAGNKDGSIPAWTGEKVKIPASWDPKEPQVTPDPWNDKPLYTITAQNMDKYADKLTPGQKGMFKVYPSYQMDIYPTHRTALFPKWLLENTIKNATSAKAANAGLKLEGAYAGVPFPIPKNGNEVIWNHVLAWAPLTLKGIDEVWSVANNGTRVLQGRFDVHYQFPFWDNSVPGIRTRDTKYWVLRFDAIAPARKVGEKYVIINALDAIDPGQRAWIYVPGQRRVKLAPDLAYDTPSPVSGGSSTMDEGKVFMGAQDRYDFKLIGKEERYILVNQQKASDYKVCPPEKAFQKNFMHPDCARFELHRAWHVEMTLKPGFRNLQPKRAIYVDEDWTGGAVGETYDSGGKLYRVDYAPITLMYDASAPDVQYQNNQSATTYDLQTGNWGNSAWFAFKDANYVGGFVPGTKMLPGTFYSPEALAGEGIR
jgi:hypothetical protein